MEKDDLGDTKGGSTVMGERSDVTPLQKGCRLMQYRQSTAAAEC